MVCASCKTLYMLSHTQPCHDLGTEMICVYRGRGGGSLISGEGGLEQRGSLQILDPQ